MIKANVLISTFPTNNQNKGGVQNKINNIMDKINGDERFHLKKFHPWEDIINDYDIIHIFKAHHSQEELVNLAKKKGKKIVINSILPISDYSLIKKISSNFWKLNLLTQLKSHSIFTQLNSADKVISLGDYETKILTNIYRIDKKNIIHIPNGYPDYITEAKDNLFKEKYNLDKFILTVGRIEKNKNQLNIIKSIKGIDIKLVCIGDYDPKDPYYIKCKELGGKQVIFTGPLPYNSDELASAYKDCSIYMLASFEEIFSNTVMEALAAGANVAISNSMINMFRYIGDMVEIFNPNKITEIKNLIVNCTVKPKKPLNEKIKLLNWKEITEQYKSVYLSII